MIIETNYSIVEIRENDVIKVRNKETAPPEMFINESMALKYVAENTTIPVPVVFDASEDRIRMSRIEGTTLEVAWKTYSTEQKENVMKQLHGYLRQLWNITNETIRSFAGPTLEFGSLVDERFNRSFPKAPYKSISEYYEVYLIKENKSDVIVPDLDEQPFRLRHGDLHGRNIMVHEGQITAILDWALAGFYLDDPNFAPGADGYLLDPIIKEFSPYDFYIIKQNNYFTRGTVFEDDKYSSLPQVS